jgi:protein MpaA
VLHARRSTLLAMLVPLAIGACAAPAKSGSSRSSTHDSAFAHPPPAAGGQRGEATVVVIGHSVRGREILARTVGSPAASRRILIVGCVHGNEPAGEAITRRLRTVTPPARTALWLVDEFNPDGCRAHTRQNAHGVDLNRNSPWHWQPLERPGGTYYSGQGPLSEPESRAINRLVRKLRPAVSIWYHQHASLVDYSSGGSPAIERRYADAVGLPVRYYGVFPGSITSWQDSTYPADTAFVVELPAGALAPSAVARHVAAVLRLAAHLA